MIGIAELLDQLNMDSVGSNGPELLATLAAAKALVESRCGSLGTTGATVLSVTSRGGRVLVLPAVRLGEVTEILDPSGTVVPLAEVTVDAEAGLVTVPAGYAGSWTVTVAADDTVPADLRLAVLMIAAHLYESQRITQPGRAGFGGGEVPPGASPGYAVPNRAATLMAPYRLHRIA